MSLMLATAEVTVRRVTRPAPFEPASASTTVGTFPAHIDTPTVTADPAGELGSFVVESTVVHLPADADVDEACVIVDPAGDWQVDSVTAVAGLGLDRLRVTCSRRRGTGR